MYKVKNLIYKVKNIIYKVFNLMYKVFNFIDIRLLAMVIQGFGSLTLL